MNISDEAVEAAAKASFDVEMGGLAGLWEDQDPAAHLTYHAYARVMLEAAAPHLMAELAEPGSAMREAMCIAWEQGREDGYHHKPNPYRSEGAGEPSA